MDIRELRYFVAIAREENMTHAAELMHVSQPTLSRQMVNLEEELGVKLFERGNRNTTLTDKGILLFQRATEIIEMVDKAENEVREDDEIINGQIVIGSAISSSARILSKLIKGFHDKYPLAHFDLITGTADNIKEKMDKGLVDIGILIGQFNKEKYEVLQIPMSDRFVLFMSCDALLAEKEFVTKEDLLKISLTVPKTSEQQNYIEW